MLSVLTKYLFASRQLYIPHIGSFEVVQLPARLDIADKLIYPPTCDILYKEGGAAREIQWSYLGEELETSPADVRQQLEQFGLKLKERLKESTFDWKGLGILEYKNNKVVFHQASHAGYLQPVEAHKVLRENAPHTVLIGEQEVHSHDVADLLHASAKKRSYTMIIAWVLLALAILFIIYYFYKEGFHIGSSGLKTKAVSVLVGRNN